MDVMPKKEFDEKCTQLSTGNRIARVRQLLMAQIEKHAKRQVAEYAEQPERATDEMTADSRAIVDLAAELREWQRQ